MSGSPASPRRNSGTSRVRICRSVACTTVCACRAKVRIRASCRSIRASSKAVRAPSAATTSRPARCEPILARQVDALAQPGDATITGFERRVGLTGPREGIGRKILMRALALIDQSEKVAQAFIFGGRRMIGIETGGSRGEGLGGVARGIGLRLRDQGSILAAGAGVIEGLEPTHRREQIIARTGIIAAGPCCSTQIGQTPVAVDNPAIGGHGQFEEPLAGPRRGDCAPAARSGARQPRDVPGRRHLPPVAAAAAASRWPMRTSLCMIRSSARAPASRAAASSLQRSREASKDVRARVAAASSAVAWALSTERDCSWAVFIRANRASEAARSPSQPRGDREHARTVGLAFGIGVIVCFQNRERTFHLLATGPLARFPARPLRRSWRNGESGPACRNPVVWRCPGR